MPEAEPSAARNIVGGCGGCGCGCTGALFALFSAAALIGLSMDAFYEGQASIQFYSTIGLVIGTLLLLVGIVLYLGSWFLGDPPDMEQ